MDRTRLKKGVRFFYLEGRASLGEIGIMSNLLRRIKLTPPPVFALTLVSALFLQACGSARLGAGGILYSETITPLAVTASQPGNRIGEACATSIFGLIARGDASIETARRNGAITLISTVDENYSNVIGISRHCTVVRGR